MMERNIPKRWEVPWERNPSFFAKILSSLFGPRGRSHLGRKRPPFEERSGGWLGHSAAVPQQSAWRIAPLCPSHPAVTTWPFA